MVSFKHTVLSSCDPKPSRSEAFWVNPPSASSSTHQVRCIFMLPFVGSAVKGNSIISVDLSSRQHSNSQTAGNYLMITSGPPTGGVDRCWPSKAEPIPPPPTHVSLFCPHSETWICVFLIILYVQYRCICPFSLMKASSGSNHLALDTEGYSNIANLLPWPLSCSKGNFHISSHHKFELSCSKCSAFLFRALWEQSFPSDCISMLTFPENCQSCSKSPSILNGQIKLCLSRAVIYLLRGLRTRFQKIRFGEIMRFKHILNMTHLLRLYYLNLGAL